MTEDEPGKSWDCPRRARVTIVPDIGRSGMVKWASEWLLATAIAWWRLGKRCPLTSRAVALWRAGQERPDIQVLVRRVTRQNDKVATREDALVAGAARKVSSERQRPLASLAHELKTPISAIAVAADVMAQEQLGPLGNDKYRDYAKDIHTSALLVLAIVDRLMARRSGDDEGARLARSKISVGALLADVCSSMRPLAMTSGVSLDLSLPNDTSESTLLVMADEVSVKQILLNLISNAIKYSVIGGRIELGALALANGTIKISVTDTGAGMTSNQIEMAMAGEPVPLDQSPPVGRGLGIGLAIVRALCEANGARLVLLSEGPQLGTSAQIVFGADRVEAAEGEAHRVR